MSAVIQDLGNMTDSRELMEAKPHPVASIFLYLLFLLLISAVIWAYFGEIDIVVKGNSVVRPNSKVSSIKSKIAGKVESVHYKAGQKVKAGDVLFTLERKDLDIEEMAVAGQLDEVQSELADLNKFKQRVLLQKSAEVLGPSGANGEDQYVSTQVTRQRLQLELNRLKRSAQQTGEALSNMQLLEQSIERGTNLFADSRSEYYNKYLDYEMKRRKLELIVTQRQQSHVLVTKTAVEEDILTSKKQVDDARLDLNSYTNEFALNLRTAMEESKRSIESMEADIGKIYVEINNSIKTNEEKLKKLEDQARVIGLNAQDRIVKAPIDGTINSIMEVSPGDLLQAGAEVVTVVPTLNSEYIMQVTLQNKDIATIKPGDTIKYQFQALPYKEYGELTGRVTTIGADAIMNQNGDSFYSVEASVDRTTLYNKKGEPVSIKAGMLAEAHVITSSKKILHYLLEKIDLKE